MSEQPWDQVMFEVYQEEGYGGRYQVVYFTELNDHNKEWEINRALAGRHVYDGFIPLRRAAQSKEIIESFLRRWNAGEAPSADELDLSLIHI